MDNYGVFRDLDEDYKLLAQAIMSDVDITFTWSMDEATAYIISICRTVSLGGSLPWGGSIEGKHLVALRRYGSEFFDLYSRTELHPDYLIEKLNLSSAAADQIAHFFYELKERMK